MQKLISIVGFLFIIQHCFSQLTITGQTIDSISNEPIPYVNIGIVQKGVGTISDENGNFTLTIPNESLNESLLFSCLGYKAKIENIKDLQNKKNKIILSKASFNLSEVVVKPYEKTKRIGNRTKAQKMAIGFKQKVKGSEIGSLIRNKRKAALIQNIMFSLIICKYDSIPFRLNIYSVKDDLPDKSLIENPLYIVFKKEDSHSIVTINVEHLKVITDDDFIISLECLQDEPKIFFSAKMFTGKFMERKTSQDKWVKMPIGMGVRATIKY